jgi:putative endonuclease
MRKTFFVYMMANRPNGTLYIGVTSDPLRRIHQHRTDLVDGFTKRYRLHRLVWLEAHDDAESAILREKRLKNWRRAWKTALIEAVNPGWRDLYPEISR